MISIIIPTIRPRGRDRCIKSIYENTRHGIVYEIVTEEDTNRIGSNLMIKKLTYRTKFDNVLFLGDDTEVEKDCIYEAWKVMNSFEDEWGMVGLNDGINSEHFSTHWMCHKKLLPHLDGEFLHTGYRHSFSDNELLYRCKQINRYKLAEKAKINHINPITKQDFSLWDKDYDRIYSQPYWLHDKKLFEKRLKEGFKNAS